MAEGAAPETAPGHAAGVDVGTNSVRLLIVDAAGRQLDRRMTITRLGRAVDETGRLDDAALERTLQTAREYRGAWEQRGVPPERVRIAATSAVRDASDRDRFFDGIREATGVTAEVITGLQEAELAFRGACGALGVARPTAVLDVGGGSTEIVVGDGHGTVAAAVSLQLGCVRLTERALRSDPPRPDELTAAGREISARLDEADEQLDGRGAAVADTASLVGVAGTVTTLAALHLGLTTYRPERVHGTRIPAAAVRTWTDRLAGMTRADRAGLGPMAAGREDVIAGGALIVAGVVDRYDLDGLVASEADSLDGLAASVT